MVIDVPQVCLPYQLPGVFVKYEVLSDVHLINEQHHTLIPLWTRLYFGGIDQHGVHITGKASGGFHIVSVVTKSALGRQSNATRISQQLIGTARPTVMMSNIIDTIIICVPIKCHLCRSERHQRIINGCHLMVRAFFCEAAFNCCFQNSCLNESSGRLSTN